MIGLSYRFKFVCWWEEKTPNFYAYDLKKIPYYFHYLKQFLKGEI